MVVPQENDLEKPDRLFHVTMGIFSQSKVIFLIFSFNFGKIERGSFLAIHLFPYTEQAPPFLEEQSPFTLLMLLNSKILKHFA
jgi:hypothetical protein